MDEGRTERRPRVGCLPAVVIMVFTLVGLGLLILAGLGLHQRLAPRFWSPASAVILESAVAEDSLGDGFRPRVRYRYDWNGESHEGARLTFMDQRSAHRDEVLARLEPFPPEARVGCFVDPDQPRRAVLAFDEDLAVCLWVGIGGLVVLGVAFGAWTGIRATNERDAARGATIFGASGGFVFMVVGLGILLQVALPAWRVGRETLRWEERPCEIVKSRVKSEPSGDKRSDRAEVAYAYEFRGRSYVGDRIEAISGFTSNAEQRALGARFYVGQHTVCYVDPERPRQAVLLRGETGAPLNFIGAGVFILVGFLVAFSPMIRGWIGRRRGGLPT